MNHSGALNGTGVAEDFGNERQTVGAPVFPRLWEEAGYDSGSNRQGGGTGVRKDLEGRFQDEFVFDPIIVNPELDHYGDEFLHIYIIFDGDQKKLDPKWTVGLERRILEDVPVDEVTRLPGHAFIPKSEWKEVYKERVP